GWCASRDPREVMETLQSRGVPAGALLDVRDMFQDPQLRARGFWQMVGNEETSPVGRKPYPTGGWKMSRTPMRVVGPPATLGQHTEDTLTGLLGVSRDELPLLEQEQVIGTVPDPLGREPPPIAIADRLASGLWQAHDPDFAEHIRESLDER